MERSSKLLIKRRRYTFVLSFLITKCMLAEIKGDEELLIDLEWPYIESSFIVDIKCSES